MAKDNRSKDQKRKAKLAKRAERQRDNEPLPYSGSKYRTDRWVPEVSETERGVYEVIVTSNRTLTNEQVRTAFVQLIHELRGGMPAAIPEDAPEVPFAPGQEVEHLVWNIRRRWRILFQTVGPVASGDLIGILRTLLYSMEAQAWDRGASRGYVDFLYHFAEGTGW